MHNQTLVVNLPWEKHHICQEISSKKSCASLETPKIPNKNLKYSLSQESELCYVSNEEKRPLFIPIYDLWIKIKVIKTTDKDDYKIYTVFYINC